MPCPILTPVLGLLRERFGDIFFEVFSDDLEDIKLRVEQDEPTLDTQRLRAAYAIDLMYVTVMKAVPFPPTKALLSVGGLLHIIESCQAQLREMCIERGIRELTNFKGYTLGNERIVMLQSTIDAATILRSHLSKNKKETWGSFGKHFAVFLRNYHNPEKTIRALQDMLEISMKNLITP